jgi:ATP-dependent exoDNAse (exonuclease V) beta subunit
VDPPVADRKAGATGAAPPEVVPLESRIEQVTDDSDLEEVYNTERQLLYVGCTRARDRHLVAGTAPGS